MAAAQVFAALGDPVRLGMLKRLSRRQRCTIAEMCEGLPITRQGARKHLQVLADAALVVLRPQGREVHVHLAAQGLGEARRFLESLERQWDARLDALRRAVEDSD
ncbi:MAG: metalloregulator ArsR/SmtB family transcription factor [Myxococcota bacterium]